MCWASICSAMGCAMRLIRACGARSYIKHTSYTAAGFGEAKPPQDLLLFRAVCGGIAAANSAKLLDIIGNRELEGRSPSTSSWWGAGGGKAATSTPPKEDSWGRRPPNPHLFYFL